MKCVAYMRVSTEKQVEDGLGLQSQKRDIENYCRKNELIINEWYIDDGYTGSNMDRPALQQLINDCAKKRVQCVVAFKLDRLSRSMVDGIYIIERVFQPNNVVFKCVHDSVSYDSPMEQAYTQMMAVFAQLDKNTMLLRMRGGMLERVKQGYWMGGGHTPYCYKYDKEKGILVSIPERKEQANKALNMYLNGYSDSRIKELLGYRNEITVRSILTSVVNVGMIPYKGNVYKGLHEPIFDIKEFELAQEMRKARKQAKSYSISGEANMLTGLCKCGVCGCAMRYQKWKPDRHKLYCLSRDRHMYYIPNYNPNCNNSIEWADVIEQQVEKEILKISLDLSAYKPKEKKNKLEIMSGQLDKERKKLKRLYELYADGNDTVLEMIRDLENSVSETKKRIEEEKKNYPSVKKEFVYDQIKSLADVWNDLDKTKKNLVLKSIIDKIIIVNGNIEIQLKNF